MKTAEQYAHELEGFAEGDRVVIVSAKYAREVAAVLRSVYVSREEPLVKALSAIALTPDEDNEWDGRDKFREAREIAMKALNWSSISPNESK